jgi:aspartate/glutamate racemase
MFLYIHTPSITLSYPSYPHLKIISAGFIILFSNTCVKYFDHIQPSFTLSLHLSTTTGSHFHTLIIQFFKV